MLVPKLMTYACPYTRQITAAAARNGNWSRAGAGVGVGVGIGFGIVCGIRPGRNVAGRQTPKDNKRIETIEHRQNPSVIRESYSIMYSMQCDGRASLYLNKSPMFTHPAQWQCQYSKNPQKTLLLLVDRRKTKKLLNICIFSGPVCVCVNVASSINKMSELHCADIANQNRILNQSPSRKQNGDGTVSD